MQKMVDKYWCLEGFFRHAKSTTFPQVAKLAVSFSIIIWPLMIICTLLMMFVARMKLHTLLGNDGLKKRILHLFLFPIFSFVFLYSFFWIPGDPSFAKGLTAGSRGGYAAMGAIVLAFSCYGISIVPTLFASVFFNSSK